MSSRGLRGLQEKFLSHVSHEFLSPVAAIKGYLGLLRRPEEKLSARHQTYLKSMQESLSRLQDFIENLLDLTKLDQRLLTVSAEPLDVKGLLEAAVDAAKASWKAHRMMVKVQAPPLLCVWADREHVLKILHHVLTNAIHYTPEGGKITLWAKEAGDSEVLMGITDSGVGIPPTMFDRVFERFEQVRETKNQVRKTPGTGLGLAVVKRLVKAQRGRIWIENSSSKGTTFVWTLPKPTKGLFKKPLPPRWGKAGMGVRVLGMDPPQTFEIGSKLRRAA